MTLPPSNSSAPRSQGFELLYPGVQRWIWQQGWPSLRSIQEAAIPVVLAGEQDLLISAATAGGKTEAAFLPIFSQLKTQPEPGIRVVCLSPLKALINDQYRRLSLIGDALEIPVTPWHGDISLARKNKLWKQPAGILLITPESLEALFVRRGSELPAVFSALSYLVVDELHAFIGSERGKQLQSLLHRVEQVVRRRIPRIGLSATLGDMPLAAEFLRVGRGKQAAIIKSEDDQQTIQLQVRGYRQTEPELDLAPDADITDPDSADLDDEQETKQQDELDIAAHLFKVLRGTTNLIFINSRVDVEQYADRLRRLCKTQHVPNEFWPHHGSLAKAIREDVEKALKSDKPANVVCTTTLEMGIDIGAVKSIAQVSPPFSVSSIRQRLGRSGRQAGVAAIARFYISEVEITPQTSPQDALHPGLVQTIAIINLMIFEKWCEPPVVSKLHLSTLIQQTLSLIAQYGGINAQQLWQVLCQTGAFRQVNQQCFMQLLRQLGAHDLIVQTHDGLLVLGLSGERLVNHYSFYTAFQTPDEYRIMTQGRLLGKLPIVFPLVVGQYLIFAGRRWQIVTVDGDQKVVDVKKATAGKVPKFCGGGGEVHDRIRQEMYRLYCSDEIPRFLDKTAQVLLQEARDNFQRFDLTRRAILSNGSQVLLFCWLGSKVANTIYLLLHQRGLAVELDAIAISIQGVSPEELVEHLRAIAALEDIDPVALAALVPNKVIEKHDQWLGEALLNVNYASSHLDIPTARVALQNILQFKP
ncbi:MAG: DEAD/DEAH box helicase [Spirulina sp. SIO3F2]|nr:DEAD/DEAH box helicase [Spirulina sp. SIO3F2]